MSFPQKWGEIIDADFYEYVGVELISRFGIQEGQLQWSGCVEADAEKEGGTPRKLKRVARSTRRHSMK